MTSHDLKRYVHSHYNFFEFYTRRTQIFLSFNDSGMNDYWEWQVAHQVW